MPAKLKDPSVRARANKASSRSVLREVAPGEAVIPDMPDHPQGEDWHPLSIQLWTDIWGSPMAAEYTQADERAVLILVMLDHSLWSAETTTQRSSLAAEIRLQRVSLGLDPLSRRRLEWSIESAEDAKDRGQSRRTRQATPRPAGDDPRRGLHSA